MDIARDNLDVAQSWLEMWAGIDPDNPEIQRYQQQLGTSLPRSRAR